MDQVDAILRLKNCFKELEEIDKARVYGNISAAKTKISKKIFEIAEVLDVGNFKPVDLCKLCGKIIDGTWIGMGLGKAHPGCVFKPNVPKPQGPIIHKIHSHPTLEESVGLASDRVIIDREVFERLLEKWDQIEKYLTQTAVII